MPARPPAPVPVTVLPVDPARPDEATLRRAAAVLRAGGLVAFPTETVYGLGAHALDPAAVARIYAAKGRPSYNPLIVHGPDAAVVRALAGAWPEAAARLAEAFWPGPLTLVVPRAAGVPDAVTAGLPSVALRVPAHPVARALLAAAAIPVAAPSANLSTGVSPTTAAHVVRSLGDRVDVVLDGGACPVGIESTVVSLVAPVPTVLRPGTVTAAEIASVLGRDVAVRAPDDRPAEGAALPSPGMMDRHYAPRAAVRLFPREERTARLADAPAGTAVIAPGIEDAPPLRIDAPRAPAAYAARLYGWLHAADDAGVDAVWIELPPDAPAWAGVRDRLRRAATPPPPGA